jgi:hypothetical protein
MAASLTQLTGGSFQDANGNILAFGYLTLKLSQDGNVSGVGNICSGVAITIQLDANGNVGSSTSPTPVANQYVWANSNISPINTYYKVTGFTQQGERAFGLNNQQVAAGATFNVGTWVPNSVISWFPEVSQNSDITLEVNGVPNSSQTLLNLEAGTNITITDEGNGNIQVAASAGGGPLFEADGDSLAGWTVVGSVTAGNATSIASPANLLETFLIYAGAYAYINTGITSFAGSVIEFDAYTGAGGTNAYLLFGCNATGAGPFFSAGPATYGGSGIGTSTSWAYVGSTPGEAPGMIALNATTWHHIRIEITKSGSYATWYANGATQQQFAIALEGSYIGLSAYSLNNAYIANIRVYAG